MAPGIPTRASYIPIMVLLYEQCLSLTQGAAAFASISGAALASRAGLSRRSMQLVVNIQDAKNA